MKSKLDLPMKRNLPTTLDLANEAESFAVEFDNELALDENGWALIAPYGEFPHHTGWLQRFGIENAKGIVSKFKSIPGRFKRFLRGLPLYKGHPDIHPEQYPDRNTYGTWHDLEARADGLYGRPVITDDGVKLIEGGLKFVSPRWLAMPLANSRIAEPFELISVGLTDRPNLPGRSLANSKPTTPNDTMKREDLIKLLGLANEATDEQITAEINRLKGEAAKITGLENEKKTLTTEAQKVVTLTTERDAARTDLANARQQITAERKARIDLIIDQAVADGVITPAQRPQWASDLANEATFDAKVKELANAQPQFNTASQVQGAGRRNGAMLDAKTASEQLVSLANSKMAADKTLSFENAYIAAKKERPDLVEATKKKAA